MNLSLFFFRFLSVWVTDQNCVALDYSAPAGRRVVFMLEGRYRGLKSHCHIWNCWTTFNKGTGTRTSRTVFRGHQFFTHPVRVNSRWKLLVSCRFLQTWERSSDFVPPGLDFQQQLENFIFFHLRVDSDQFSHWTFHWCSAPDWDVLDVPQTYILQLQLPDSSPQEFTAPVLRVLWVHQHRTDWTEHFHDLAVWGTSRGLLQQNGAASHFTVVQFFRWMKQNNKPVMDDCSPGDLTCVDNTFSETVNTKTFFLGGAEVQTFFIRSESSSHCWITWSPSVSVKWRNV